MTRPFPPVFENRAAPRPTVIHILRLPMSNVHLVAGRQPVLIDSGSPGDAARILRWIDRLGLGPPAYILLTHGHADHAGSAAALRSSTGAPVWLAQEDWSMASAGRNRPLRPVRPSARLLAWMLPGRFPAFTPDAALTPVSFADIGLEARLVPSPGHTAGSVSLVFPDGQAIVGDLMMGGYLGGILRPRRPRPHYFADTPGLIDASLARVVALGARWLHVGHGGPLSVDDLRRRGMA